MSKEPTRTEFPTGDFISENAVRPGFGLRQRTSRTPTAHAVNGVPAQSAARGEEASGPASGGRRLRRWSVAELIARAVTPPPSTT